MKINLIDKIIIFFIIIFIIFRGLSIIIFNFEILNILRLLLLIIYIIFVFKCYKNQKLILVLFLISLFTFQYGRLIYLPLLGKKVIMTWFTTIIPRLETLFFIIDILFWNLLGIIIAEKLYNPSRIIKNNFLKKNTLRNQILLGIILILFIPYLKFSIDILKSLNSFKYEDIYRLGIQYFYKQNTSLIEQIFYSVFLVSISFGLALSNSTKKSKIFFIIMGNIGYFLIALRGNRGLFITFLFFSFWYLDYFKIIKLNIKKIVVFMIILLIPIIMISKYRHSKQIDIIDFSIIKNVNDVLYSQGTTGSYLVLLNERKEIFQQEHIKYLISGISGYRVKKQDTEAYNEIMNLRNVNLDHKLSSVLNKKLFLKGNGMGGNYIIEMYDFGGNIAVFLLSFLLTLFFIKIDASIFKYNFLIKGTMLYYFPKIFFIPRNNYFIHIRILDICKIIFVYFLIEFFTLIIINFRKNSYENIKRIDN
ncbi:MAG: O-antigen polysaccharide polymerase Wzy [Fusobacterium sp.]